MTSNGEIIKVSIRHTLNGDLAVLVEDHTEIDKPIRMYGGQHKRLESAVQAARRYLSEFLARQTVSDAKPRWSGGNATSPNRPAQAASEKEN